jgi:hypothetical protein
MRCRGVQGIANPPYLSGFLFSGLLRVAPNCVPGGIRMVSTTPSYRPNEQHDLGAELHLGQHDNESEKGFASCWKSAAGPTRSERPSPRGFIFFAPTAYPARNKVHAGEDSCLKVSVRSSWQRFLGRVTRLLGGHRVRYCPAEDGGMLRLKRKTFSGS